MAFSEAYRQSLFFALWSIKRSHQDWRSFFIFVIHLLFTVTAHAVTSAVLPLDCSAIIFSAETKDLPYRITDSYPHRAHAFTQGLVYEKGHLYESTGQLGESSVAKIRLKDGKVIQHKAIDNTLFGEGLAIWQDQLIQLTWTSGQVLRHKKTDLSLISQQSIDTEGWGLTHNGQHLINTDGSAKIYYRDPISLALVKTVTATYLNRPIKKLNELEWVDQCLLANIWQTPYIAVIQPDSGKVLGLIDLSVIIKKEQQQSSAGVANGIAVLPSQQSLLITGKYWRRVYQLQFIDKD